MQKDLSKSCHLSSLGILVRLTLPTHKSHGKVSIMRLSDGMHVVRNESRHSELYCS